MAIFGKPFFESKSEDVEGVYSKGVFCLQNNDLYKANDYFKQASAKGHISAMYNLSILNGSGSISPYDIDFAVDCFRQAAVGEHPNAKQLLIWLQKADDTSLGIEGLILFASKLPAHNSPNHVLMMAGCRFYKALCERYRATNAVIKYELDAANSSEYDYVHNFIKRTGISRITYEGGLNGLEEGSAAYQITDSLNSLHFALKQSGYSDHLCIMIRLTIVGYIVSKSTYSSNAKPMLGVDKFFD